MRKYRQAILAFLITTLIMVLVWLTNRDQPALTMRAVISLKQAVAAGAEITADDIVSLQLPDDPALNGYVSDETQVIGRWTLTSLAAGELIHSGHLAEQAAGLTYPQAGPGRRIMTIKLNPEDANGFWLAAGNRIDLHIIPRRDSTNWPTQVIRDVRIMALLNTDGTRLAALAGTNAQSSLLCLDVSDEQASLLANAEKQADIKLAVINESVIENAGEAAGRVAHTAVENAGDAAGQIGDAGPENIGEAPAENAG